MSVEEKDFRTEALKKLIGRAMNELLADKTKNAAPMGYIDVFLAACDMVEKVSNHVKKKRKDIKNITSSHKLELACEIIMIITDRLREVDIPGEDRKIILDEDYTFIKTMTGPTVQALINSIIAVIRGAESFGSLTDSDFIDDVVKSGCSCFKFIKTKSKTKTKPQYIEK